MKRRKSILLLVVFGLILAAQLTAVSGDNTFEPNLEKLAANKGLRIYNREIQIIDDYGTRALHFNARPGVGLAWIEDYQFTNGIIEFDVRGKNIPQKSFVGIAFHGKDDSLYEAVYFRPFNFVVEDSVQRSHSLQYIASPSFSWKRLRTENPGVYERAIHPPLGPDGWFHVRVVVRHPKVGIFVNNAKTPALEIEELGDRVTGDIGFWVGDNSGGDFAGLRITPAP